LHQAAHDVADHVMQIRVGAKVSQQKISAPFDAGKVQRFNRRLGLTLGGAKRAEVVLTQQQGRSLIHRCCIQRPKVPTHASVIQCRSHGVIEQHIAIAALDGVKPRVKLRIDFARP